MSRVVFQVGSSAEQVPPAIDSGHTVSLAAVSGDHVFHVQIRLMPVHGSRSTAYLYAGDRWGQFDQRVRGIGRYGWYPMTFDATGKPIIDGLDQWSINVSTGQWRP
jgi:hypothetical protein